MLLSDRTSDREPLPADTVPTISAIAGESDILVVVLKISH